MPSWFSGSTPSASDPARKRAGRREVTLFADSLLRSSRVERGGREKLDALRRRRLQGVLRAAQRTALYGDQISDAVIAEGRLDAITPVRKSTFVERLEDTFVDGRLSRQRLLSFVRQAERAGRLLDDRYLVAMTSGTSGQVGVFVNDIESWARTRGVTFARIFREELNARGFVRLVRYRRYRMAFVVATGGHYMTSILATRVPDLGKLVVESKAISIETPLDEIVDELNRTGPHLLHSYPTVLELLAAEVRAGRLKVSPEIVTTGSEPLTPSCRAAVKEAFPKARLVETYAATECVPLATACREGHLHVNEDACVIEPVDAEGRAVGVGEVADHIYVTNLLNRVQPLVRYILTDSVELVPGRCPCGSPFQRLRVHGRTDDTFFLRASDGTWQAHPPIPLEVLFLSVPGLLQYQLVHEVQNRLRVFFVSEAGVSGGRVAGVLDDKIARYLSEHGLSDAVSYSIEEVAEIERHSESKKLRQIRSRVARPDAAVRSAQESKRQGAEASEAETSEPEPYAPELEPDDTDP